MNENGSSERWRVVLDAEVLFSLKSTLRTYLCCSTCCCSICVSQVDGSILWKLWGGTTTQKYHLLVLCMAGTWQERLHQRGAAAYSHDKHHAMVCSWIIICQFSRVLLHAPTHCIAWTLIGTQQCNSTKLSEVVGRFVSSWNWHPLAIAIYLHGYETS